MTYKATALRQNLYAILDSVIDSGQAVEIEAAGIACVLCRKTAHLFGIT